MIKKRAQYIQTLILLDEIEYFHSNLSFEQPKTFFRELKYNILTLYKFKELLQLVSKDLKDNKEFIKLKKTIIKELDFINHIRNKISGHFDKPLLEKAAQWEPFIFYEENKNEELKVLMSYKTLFESSINSYIDKNNCHLIYQGEIDLNIQNDRTKFLKTIYKLNETSIKILFLIKISLENQNIFFAKRQQYIESKKAGLTNFNLKSNNLELKSLSDPLIEESFLMSLDLSNVNDLKLLLSKIEDKISS
ncbi:MULTISPECIES: hypothetical protein [unclassified Myroides]|uniref:hypothetical protein n=1 Tax=unclassified Myroides TaxID=2642485 RepID=UPI003100EC6B